MKILIKNIKELVGIDENNSQYYRGKELAEKRSINNAFLAIEQGKIVGFGSMEDWEGIRDWNGLEVIDASNKLVLPAWCDAHTHIVYAGSREKEFVDRIHGLSYEEIAENGGGILNSAKRLQNTEEQELFESALNRLHEIRSFGTGAVEIKSGYGLTVEAEIKMLRVIKKLKLNTDLTIKSNFLGAHAIPTAYKNDRATYINMIVDEMLPIIAKEQLAEFIDVFCDKGFYTPEETDYILKAGKKIGLIPKIHANELDYSGGVQVGVENMALSVDHLECVGEAELKALQNDYTMPTLLPSTAFFLKLEYPPARKIIENNLPIALATDYNPGSSPSGNMPFILSLACIQMNMDPIEAVSAATLNGAYAMGLQNELGSISIGKKANIIITKEIPSLSFIPYSFGSQLIDRVIINGK
jgi:imidazolonepropionase